jgi:hypothetical protein
MNNKQCDNYQSAKIEISLYTANGKLATETRLYEKGKQGGYKLTVSGVKTDGTNYAWGFEAKKKW